MPDRHARAVWRKHQSPRAGVGLRRLDDQPLAFDSDGRRWHVDGAQVEVDGVPGQAGCFPDAQPGGHHEADEIGQVPADGRLVVAECGAQLPELGHGHRPRRLPGLGADRLQGSHRIAFEGVMAGGQRAHA
jgi:hypothetical protein